MQNVKIVLISLVLVLLVQTMQAQKQNNNVNYQYNEVCLTIKKETVADGEYEDSKKLLFFENDSLFQYVRWFEVRAEFFVVPKECLSKPLVCIELVDDVEYVYLLDENKKALAICYPEETHFEVQWFSNGKNSMLKQWEMVTINLEYVEDPEQEITYQMYEEIVFVRSIDRSGFPEDFELTVSYFDEDGDGVIEKVVSTEKK